MTPILKTTLTASVTGLVLLGGLVALGGWRGHGGFHGHRDPAEVAAFVTDRVDDTLDDLDASPDQRARIHAVKDRMLAAGRAFHDEAQGSHRVVLEAWKSEAPDRARLHALVDERFEAARALAHQAVDAGVDVHAALTPEQREKITRKIERRMSWVER